MSDQDSRGSSGGADHLQSAPDAAPAPLPFSPPSSSSSSVVPASSSAPLHAQAVRFLTSLRHHSPNASVEAQRQFLKGKGLDETAISAAFEDAQRPSSLASSIAISPPPPSFNSGTAETLSQEAAFDQAARAFDDPIHNPAPVVPARNYPRSPLALYYEEAQGRVVEANRREESSRRYQVLLGFFRSISWFLTFTGGVGALGVLLYRLYVMPKLVTTLDSRSFLLKHHHSLWNNIVRSVQTLSQGSLVSSPPAVLAAKTADLDQTEAKIQGRRSSLKKVQFADEVKGGRSLEQREGKGYASPLEKTTQLDREKTNMVVPGTDIVVPAMAKDSMDTAKGELTHAEEGFYEEDGVAVDDVEVEPIDVSQPLRASLAALSHRLRGGEAEASAAMMLTPLASSQVPVGKATSVTDDEEGSSSDGSWQDDRDSEEEELELDPFAPPRKKGSKRRTSHKKRKTSETSAPTTATAAAAAIPPSSTTAHEPSANLYKSLLDLNSSLTARILYSQTKSFRASATGGPYGTFTFAQNLPSSSVATTASGEGIKEGETDTVMETSAQIRAEIRSLKGLLLSRRNFPKPNGTVSRPPAPPSFSTST